LNLTSVGGDAEDAKMKPGFQLGVVADYALSDAFSIQPGLLIATQGYKVKNDGYKSTTNVNYLQVPINAQYKLDLGGMKLLLQAGPYLGIALSGKTKSKYDGESESESIKFGSGDEDQMKRGDFGLGFGAGLQFGNIQAGLGYNIGLANIADSDDVKVKNNGLAITVTYLFGK
jgi:hypothetical protein